MMCFKNYKASLALVFFLGLSTFAYNQSAKKYYKNGMYEMAYVKAVYKQNKKVKLKTKFTDIIYDSYEKIYATHMKAIKAPKNTWQHAYNATIRMVKFRAKCTHPTVKENLKNILYDDTALDHLGIKFNISNEKDMTKALAYEIDGKFDKALAVYKGIQKRHEEAEPITTLEDRLIIIDYEDLIEQTNQKMGDKLIEEAMELLGGTSESNIHAAIAKIKQARSHRPLSPEEEDLLELANMMLGDKWMEEADKLLETKTKHNARIAYGLIEKTRSKRTLTPEEEIKAEKAKELGMTNILVSIKGLNPIHTVDALSGILNKGKYSSWITYYYIKDESIKYDIELEITESKPAVTMGKLQKEVQQSSRDVEYTENETDDQGNTVQVTKTRKAIAVYARLTKTKTALIDWSILAKDPRDGQIIFSDKLESRIEHTNEYASFISGDVLGMPEESESDVNLDSQKFPTDEEMRTQVTDLYLNELRAIVNAQEFQTHKMHEIVEE